MWARAWLFGERAAGVRVPRRCFQTPRARFKGRALVGDHDDGVVSIDKRYGIDKLT